MVIPERNKHFGYLVGGTWNSSNYKESVTDYSMTEGGIDYNAGLVGALGYIVSKVDPADTSKFTGKIPEDTSSSSIRYRSFSTPQQILISKTNNWFVSIYTSKRDLIKNCSVFDPSGKLIFSTNKVSNNVQWEKANHSSGVFIIRAVLTSGLTLHERILLNRSSNALR